MDHTRNQQAVNSDLQSTHPISIVNTSYSMPALESLTTGTSSSGNQSSFQTQFREVLKVKKTANSAQFQRKPEGNRALSWRSDPTNSFSDWRIEIVVVDEGSVVSSSIYHCHSNVLVWGPRKSSKFVKLFQDRINHGAQSSNTQIQLSPSEAAVFPMLLDFTYCEASLPLSAESICSLYILADEFENELLQAALQTFVERSLNFEESVEFLSYARRHEHRTKIEKLVLFTNSKLCGFLVQNPKEAMNISPELLSHILHKRAQVIKVLKGEDPRKFSGDWELERSKLLSVVVAECCYYAINTGKPLSNHTFERLTSSKHLPAVDSLAVLKILEVDAFLQKTETLKPNESTEEMPSHPKKKRGDRKLTSLETRCLRALVMDWRNIHAVDEKSWLYHSLSHVQSHILAELMVSISNQYERALTTLKGTQERTKHEILEKPQIKVTVTNPEWNDLAVSSPRCGAIEASLTPTGNWCNEMENFEGIVNLYDDDEVESRIRHDRYSPEVSSLRE